MSRAIFTLEAFGEDADWLDKRLAAGGFDYIRYDAPSIGPSHRVVISTYGVLHRASPNEDALVVNLVTALRNPPDDPRVRERMVQLTGLDPEVRAYVLDTPGALDIIEKTTSKIRALVEGWGSPTGQTVHVHVVCKGGRHRSVAVAEEVATRLRAAGINVEVAHLDIDKPVVADRG